jgi:protocatechuate 3,4-dioxygenase beta subunit
MNTPSCLLSELSGAPDHPAVVKTERRMIAAGDPPYIFPDYRSTARRGPSRPPRRIAYGPTELTGPVARVLRPGAGSADGESTAADLTRQHGGEPLGERIIVHGRVLDGAGRPLQGALIEVWQANAAGRYRHERDTHPAPLDPHFSGAGWCLTDTDGHYRFVTIKPGAYPWQNHANAWRPAHIHFSLFGWAFSQRLVTQMYFPGDPLLDFDPIWKSIPDAIARQRLVAAFDPSATVPGWALAYRFDVTLGGRGAP